MRRHLTRLALLVLVALVLVGAGGLIGRRSPAAPASGPAAPAAPGDRLQATIARYQQRLRDVPGDWRTWAALGSAYLEWARVTADPTYYPKAEGAAQKSLSLRADGNADALVALGALAAARHDFGAARDKALFEKALQDQRSTPMPTGYWLTRAPSSATLPARPTPCSTCSICAPACRRTPAPRTTWNSVGAQKTPKA